MKKKCSECREEKDVSEFYVHAAMADGRLGKCKVCVRARVRKHRQENIESIREYDRKRGSLAKRQESAREYQGVNRTKVNAIKNEWSKRNRDKRNANQKLSRAILAGVILRASVCDLCSAGGRIEGHHPDYSKPLEVLWLCGACHRKIHKIARDNARKAT